MERNSIDSDGKSKEPADRPRWGQAIIALLILAAVLVVGVLYRFVTLLAR